MRFIINAPFLLTENREGIKEGEEWNAFLFREIANLMADSLYKIKDMGLLTTDFLAVLPNDEDNLSEFDRSIQEAIISEMKNKPLVPTHSESYASAKFLYRGPAKIREVISDKDLQFLTDDEDSKVQWAAGVMQNSREEKFIRTLGIKEWSWKELLETINDRFYFPDEENEIWLSKHSDKWMQNFYLLLKEGLKKTDEDDYWILRNCRIVRLQSGNHAAAEGVYFPDFKEKNNFNITRIQR